MSQPITEEFNQLKHDTESIRQMTDEYLLSIFEVVKAEIEKRISIDMSPAKLIFTATMFKNNNPEQYDGQ
jgi:hypothetical protein